MGKHLKGVLSLPVLMQDHLRCVCVCGGGGGGEGGGQRNVWWTKQ